MTLQTVKLEQNAGSNDEMKGRGQEKTGRCSGADQQPGIWRRWRKPLLLRRTISGVDSIEGFLNVRSTFIYDERPTKKLHLHL